MVRRLLCVVIWVAFSLFRSEGWGAESLDRDEIALPPIIREISPIDAPVDAMDEDPVYSGRSYVVEPTSANGSLTQSLEENVPLPVANPGRPGGLNQFRGLGISVEDTSIQALGIPLNYGQGGGFDFSTFPQFFWKSYQFSSTPSWSGLDPRAASGTISLVPWTASALEASQEPQVRVTVLESNADLFQLSVAGRYQQDLALLVGASSGQVSGPTVSASARLYDSERLIFKFHLLATDVQESLYNFGLSLPAQMRSSRMIPVFQSDALLTREMLLKSSLYYDNTFIRFDNYGLSSFTRDRAQQLGFENALLWGDGWKFGVGVRKVAFSIGAIVDSSSFSEVVSHAAISRRIELPSDEGASRWIFDPVLQEYSDTGFGLSPGGSVGVRREWGGSWAVFARETFSRRYPSLADRYYSIAGAQANSGLQPEKDLTSLAGVESHGESWKVLLQGYYQIRNNSQTGVLLQDGFTVQQRNLGQARIGSLMLEGSVQPRSWARISNSLTWNSSHADGLNNRFPLLADWIDLASLTLGPIKKTSFEIIGRFQSDAFTSPYTPGADLPSVAFANAELTYDWSSKLKVQTKIENLTCASLVLYPGYPPQGRVFSFSVLGQL